MMRRFSVSNFKRFRDLTVDNLSRLVLLGGANNVGKSSLLEAIFFFHDRYDAAAEFKHWVFRGVPHIRGEPEALLGAAFHNYNTAAVMAFEAQNDAHTARLEVRLDDDLRHQRIRLRPEEAAPAPQTQRLRQSVDALHLSYSIDGKKVNQGDLAFGPEELDWRLSEARESVPTAVYLLGRATSGPAEMTDRFSKLDVQGRASEVVEVVQAIHPSVTSLSLQLLGDLVLLHADVGMGRKVPVNLLGDGAIRLLSIFLGMSAAEGGVVLVDEVDTGFHWSVMPKVWRALDETSRKFRCQLVATTHSRECMAAARAALAGTRQSQEFTYIRLDDEEGQVVPKHYSFEQFSLAIDDNWEVR